MRATLFAVAVPFLLAGCASQSPLPEVTAYKSPATAGAKVPKTHYHPALTGYTHREPTAPEAWVTEDAPVAPEAVPETAPDAAMKKEDCKKIEGASDDCPAQ